MRLLSTLLCVVVVVACKAADNRPIGGVHVDAAIDATLGECGAVHKVDCVVTETCGTNATVLPTITICDNGSDGPTLEGKARTLAAMMYACTDVTTFVATCTTSKTAFSCPIGDELEDATVCIPGEDYTADTSAICTSLPTNKGACSVACDRNLLYTFATSGYHVEPCTSTTGIVYQVIAAPMTGDGAR